MSYTAFKTKLKKSAAALTCGMLLLTAPAKGYVMTVIDPTQITQNAINWAMDAADRATTLANWVTQLQNWRQNLANWVRGKMMEIPGVKKLMDKQEQKQIEQLFAKRKQRCNSVSSSASKVLCFKTVALEEKKFNLIINLDKEIKQRLDNINAIIKRQQAQAGAQNQSNQAATLENDVIAQLQALDIAIQKAQNDISRIDSMIEQYRWARTTLAKDQLQGTPDTLTKAAATVLLEKKAHDIRNKAQNLRSQTGKRY